MRFSYHDVETLPKLYTFCSEAQGTGRNIAAVAFHVRLSAWQLMFAVIYNLRSLLLSALLAGCTVRSATAFG